MISPDSALLALSAIHLNSLQLSKASKRSNSGRVWWHEPIEGAGGRRVCEKFGQPLTMTTRNV
jgi:hypothetical protein